MKATTKTFTVEEFVQAIEKDGLPQIQNAFFQDETGVATNEIEDLGGTPIVAACAVGMAAINLGVDVQSLRDSLSLIGGGSGTNWGSPTRFSSGLIEGWNDDAGLNYVQIAEKIRRWFPNLLKESISAAAETYKIGESISR